MSSLVTIGQRPSASREARNFDSPWDQSQCARGFRLWPLALRSIHQR